MRESRFAKGGQPFAWGFGGCAPDHPSLSPADSGGKNNFATALREVQGFSTVGCRGRSSPAGRQVIQKG
jgi:hypothetical protein